MLSLTFDRREIVVLRDKTFRWIITKHFTFPPAPDVESGDVLDGLINNWRYRDNYATAKSYEMDAVTIHGPFLVASISRDDFKLVDSRSFLNVVNEFLSLYDNCLLYTSPSPRDATLSRMPSSA